MRLAQGKKYGYIILPMVGPSGVAPEKALDESRNFQVVWDVLQALSAALPPISERDASGR